MGRSQSDELRRRWLEAQRRKGIQENPTGGDKRLRKKMTDAQRREGTSEEKRSDWLDAKDENERVHIHFVCTCSTCAQQFTICGIPCFVICPNCHNILILQFGQQ